jgi:hypothetical protein
MGRFQIIFIGMLAMLLTALPVFANNEFKTTTLQGGFISSFSANTNYSGLYNFTTPDGISYVKYTKVNYRIDTTAPTRFYLAINGSACNPAYWNIPGGVNDYQFFFDCTSLLGETGVFNATIWSNATLRNFYGDVGITYINNPYSIGYGGTEYTVGESGTVYVRLLDGSSKPINLASCNATIFYPNKTVWINKQTMTLLDGGYYYYDIVVPDIAGVYIVGFDCIIPAQIFKENRTIGFDIGASVPTFTDTFPFDDTNNYTINNAYINYSVSAVGGGAANDYYFNGVKIASGSGTTQNINVVLNQSNFINAEEQQYSVVRTALSSTVNWAYLYVNYTTNTPQQTVRGQTELHVSNIPANVWNYTNRTLTDYNQTWINGQLISIGTLITSVNSTLNYWGNYLTSLINGVAGAVWNYGTRNLTDYNQTWQNGVLIQIQNSQNQIGANLTDVNATLYNLIVSHNSTVMNKLYGIQGELASINDTVKGGFNSLNNNLLNNFTSLNSTITTWGNFFDSWFRGIEYKLDNITQVVNTINTTLYNLTIGNITVNASIDTTAVAMETLRQFCYYGAIDIYDPGVCQGPVFRGQRT